MNFLAANFSSDASGGCLQGRANFKVEKAHFAARTKGPESRKNEVKLRPPLCHPLRHSMNFPWKLTEENLLCEEFRHVFRQSLAKISPELRSGGLQPQHCVSCGIADYRCYTPTSFLNKNGLSQSKDRPTKGGIAENNLPLKPIALLAF